MLQLLLSLNIGSEVENIKAVLLENFKNKIKMKINNS